MTRRHVLEVTLNGHQSLIRAYGARELLQMVTQSPPFWLVTLRGWSCQEKTARAVIDAAEAAGFDVVVNGPRSWSSSGVAPAVGGAR